MAMNNCMRCHKPLATLAMWCEVCCEEMTFELRRQRKGLFYHVKDLDTKRYINAANGMRLPIREVDTD